MHCRCGYKMHQAAIVGARPWPYATTVYICAIMHEQVACRIDARNHNAVIAGGYPCVGNPISERHVIKARFGSTDRERIAQSEPRLDERQVMRWLSRD